MNNAECLCCGKVWDETNVLVIARTAKPKCYVFQGEPGDPRNGLDFHNKDSVRFGPALIVQTEINKRGITLKNIFNTTENNN